MAFVKVTQSLHADVERTQKLYQAHLILIFRLGQSHSSAHGRHGLSAGGDHSFNFLTSEI